MPFADHGARAADYVAAFEAVVDEPWLIGWHWCSYVENYARGWGLKSPEDDAYDDLVRPIKAFNESVPSNGVRGRPRRPHPRGRDPSVRLAQDAT